MTSNCKEAEYIRVSKECDLYRLRGSKYLQAKIGDAFQSVKKDLEDDRMVLFSGTGCIVNGLRLFLGKEYDRLICVDVVCHGAPSQKLWEKYVDYIEKKNKAKVKSVNFRCKDVGWRDFGNIIGKNEETWFSPKKTDMYLQMFLSDYCLRPSCYECRAKENRLSDLTLGDFWGVEKIVPEMNDNKGTSWVITRTNKGLGLLSKIEDSLELLAVPYEKVVEYNSAEERSVLRPRERESFFVDMEKYSMEQLEKIYLSVPIREKLRHAARDVLNHIRGKGKHGGAKSNLDYGIMFLLEKR